MSKRIIKFMIVCTLLILSLMSGCRQEEFPKNIMTPELAEEIITFNCDTLGDEITNYIDNLRIVYGIGNISLDELKYKIIEDENNGYIIVTIGEYEETTIMIWNYTIEDSKITSLTLERTLLESGDSSNED